MVSRNTLFLSKCISLLSAVKIGAKLRESAEVLMVWRVTSCFVMLRKSQDVDLASTGSAAPLFSNSVQLSDNPSSTSAGKTVLEEGGDIHQHVQNLDRRSCPNSKPWE